MASPTRKQAIRDFKDQPPSRGAFAIRCLPTQRVWVGASPNLGAVRNREWFALRQGQHRDKALQAEWTAHGEAAFQFEVLETLETDVLPLAIPDLLKEKKRDWAARLGAGTLLA